MKIFYTGLENDHYAPKNGKSFEYNNFYLSLKGFPGAEVIYFPFEKILLEGKRKFNDDLLLAVKEQHPDLLFVFMYSDEFDTRILGELKKYTKTIAWFADDSWRFYNYSKYWAKYFTWAVTTYSWMPELYKKAGQPNVVRSQWAADPSVYKPQPALPASTVAFVGGKTPGRERIIASLLADGIKVETFGRGWAEGRISEEKMMGVFSNAKINLALNPPPGMWTMNSVARLFLKPHANKIIPSFDIVGNVRSFFHQNIPQIKARHFEIPACGGFIITSPADDIEKYYEPDKEIVLYRSYGELKEKIRYYIAHETERKKIAEAARARTLRDHTYRKRFEEIFKAINL